MNIILTRIYETGIHTCGLLQVDNRVWTALEDAPHQQKIPGKTRIPAGTYTLGVREVSPMSSRYRERFGPDHEGMLWLQDVPNFDYVYIHIGNIAEDTRGCILIGRTMTPQQGFIGESKAAYEEFWPLVQAARQSSQLVTIEVRDVA